MATLLEKIQYSFSASWDGVWGKTLGTTLNLEIFNFTWAPGKGTISEVSFWLTLSLEELVSAVEYSNCQVPNFH